MNNIQKNCPVCGNVINDLRYSYCTVCYETRESKRRRKQFTKIGKCLICFLNDSDDGLETCHTCREQHKTWTDQQKEENKWKSAKLKRTAKGLCQICRQELDNKEFTRCTKCREKNKAEMDDARKNGKCIRCKKADRHNDFLTCDTCRKDSRERRYWLKEMGLCQNCEKNQITPGIGLRGKYSTCEACREKAKKKYQSKKDQYHASGLCYQCNKQIAVAGQMNCATCILKAVSRTHFGSNSQWEKISDIYIKQDCRCVYTGLKITIGIDAALDHIVPVSAGGVNDVSNVQWVHKYVNIAKHAHSELEFFSLIKMIYSHCNLHDFQVTELSVPGRRFAKKEEEAA